MNRYFRFSILSIIVTYLLIFIGGLVRVSGAGMGCPDWPKCFDRWIPPTNISQVPEIYIEKFNLVLAWVEYMNRLFGALVGLIILISLILAFLYMRYNKQVFLSILAALLLTLVEGWLGSKLVDTVLDPFTITLHLILALIIIGLIIYSSINAYVSMKGNFEKNGNYPQKLKWFVLGILYCIIIEVIIGTEIRGGLDISRKENPLVEGVILLKMLGPFKYIHTILGLVLLVFAYNIKKILSQTPYPVSPIMLLSVNMMLVLFGMQILLGEILVFCDVKPIIQLFHMWFSSLLLGLSVLQYTCIRLSESK